MTIQKHTILLIKLLMLLLCNKANGQSHFSTSAGIGRYELTHLAIHLHISPSSSFSLLGGTNFGINNNKQFSVGFAFDQTLFNSKQWKVKPGYVIESVLWTSDDELYFFKTLSFPIMLNTTYYYSKVWSFRIEGGVAFNTVLESDRKQNVTSGFPLYFNGNYKFSVIYRLQNRKAKNRI